MSAPSSDSRTNVFKYSSMDLTADTRHPSNVAPSVNVAENVITISTDLAATARK